MPVSAVQQQASKARATQMRRCIATGRVRRREQLLRFVVDPGGHLVADVAGKLPGRGLWITPQRDLIGKACRKGLFAKAARSQLRADGDLAAEAEALLRKRCLDLLGLARRAGLAVTGFEKVKAWLECGKAAVLLEASDGARGGREKLLALARAKAPEIAPVGLFGSEELARALGREHCVHAALASGGMADRFLADVGRLAQLAGTPDHAGCIDSDAGRR